MTLTEILLVIILVVSALAVVGIALAIFCLISLRNKIAVQRLKFLGFYSQDKDTRENYAEFVVGNRALNEVGIAELGLKNGAVTFDLTGLYKKKAGLRRDDKLMVEQRSSLKFRMSEEELASVLVDGKNGKRLGTLKMYCVDFTGALYTGRVKGVTTLAKKVLAEVNDGKIIPKPQAASDEE